MKYKVIKNKELKFGDRETLNDKYGELLIQLLINRGIDTPDKIFDFLNVDFKNISNPFLLDGMEDICNKIIESINNKEKICIYGDYDVDGITSTALLYKALNRIGAKDVIYYIPSRSEGYSLNKKAVENLKELGVDTIITVDCGITSFDEIKLAKKLRMKVYITDHHEIRRDINLKDEENLYGEQIYPNADAIITCQKDVNQYKYKNIAGVGTVFFLVMALFSKFKIENEILDYIDLAMTGTIADVMTLTNDNRIITKIGLENIKNKGLKKLVELAVKKEKITSTDIAFIIAPILNASSRMSTPYLALELLLNEDNKRITKICFD